MVSQKVQDFVRVHMQEELAQVVEDMRSELLVAHESLEVQLLAVRSQYDAKVEDDVPSAMEELRQDTVSALEGHRKAIEMSIEALTLGLQPQRFEGIEAQLVLLKQAVAQCRGS